MVVGEDFEPGCEIDAEVDFDEFHGGAELGLVVRKVEVGDDEGEVEKEIHDF